MKLKKVRDIPDGKNSKNMAVFEDSNGHHVLGKRNARKPCFYQTPMVPSGFRPSFRQKMWGK